MSRSGYSCELDNWDLIRYRGAVTSAIKGKRGQAFLKELLATLDAMPEKKLIRGDLATPQGEVCALGSVAVARGLNVAELDSENHKSMADALGINEKLVAEIEFINDDDFTYCQLTDEDRFIYVRRWVVKNIRSEAVA